jgi:hypothetical protein
MLFCRHDGITGGFGPGAGTPRGVKGLPTGLSAAGWPEVKIAALRPYYNLEYAKAISNSGIIYMEKLNKKGDFFRKYSANPLTDHFFSKVLKFLFRGYNQTSLIGTLIFPGGPSFPLPLVCPTLHQLAAL